MSQPTVKRTLTANRTRRVVENDEYGSFVTRILRAYAARIAQGDIEALADLAALRDEVDRDLHTAITGLRAEGYSWSDIAQRLGVTKQAAQQRWGTAVGDR